MAKWYYEKGGLQQGPVEEADIRGMLDAGEIGWEAQIWTKGQGDWLPASEVLSKSAAAAPARAEPEDTGGYDEPEVQSAPASPAPMSQPTVAPAPAAQSDFNMVVFVMLIIFFWPGAIYYYMNKK